VERVTRASAGHRATSRRWWAAAAGHLVVVVVAAGCTASPQWVAAPTPVSQVPGARAPLPTAELDGAGGAPPSRIRIPAIGVDAPLERLHLARDGTLQPPTDYAEAGWYADGTRPGDIGPAVIAGHIDSVTGPAVFARLSQVGLGAVIGVDEDGTWLTFHVVSVDRYPKTAFPTAQVYGPTPDAELRLITCGGVFDHTHKSYLDNVVVYAVAG
jgi:hypothetical protein